MKFAKFWTDKSKVTIYLAEKCKYTTQYFWKKKIYIYIAYIYVYIYKKNQFIRDDSDYYNSMNSKYLVKK